MRVSQSFVFKLITGKWEIILGKDVYVLFFACCPEHLLLVAPDRGYQVKWSVDLIQYGCFSVPSQIINYFLGHKGKRHWCEDTCIR